MTAHCSAAGNCHLSAVDPALNAVIWHGSGAGGSAKRETRDNTYLRHHTPPPVSGVGCVVWYNNSPGWWSQTMEWPVISLYYDIRLWCILHQAALTPPETGASDGRDAGSTGANTPAGAATPRRMCQVSWAVTPWQFNNHIFLFYIRQEIETHINNISKKSCLY